jgi:hypothetical protein
MPERRDPFDVPNTTLNAWPEALGHGELALEQLTSPPDRAKRVALDNEEGRVRDVHVPPTRTDLH